jgi:glycosyltransferase involved in cell wall biosynthesis
MPKISVLMPAHNADSTIRLAALSTLRALPRDAELVILDDGSTDGTADVLARIPDRRLRVIRRPESGGVARGLRQLAEATDSEFVGRMDADDFCYPHRFSHQMRHVHRADLVCTTISSFGHRTRPPVPVSLGPDELRLFLLLENVISHPSVLMRRSALDRVGGYHESPAEDYDLWLRMAAAGARMIRLATPGVAYRRHEGQLTRSRRWADAVLSDPGIHRSYAWFAQHCFNASGDWFPDLLQRQWGESEGEPLSDGLVEVAEILAEHAQSLPLAPRLLLRRRLRVLGL